MSRELNRESSLDLPSRYTVFEREVFGTRTSSPQPFCAKRRTLKDVSGRDPKKKRSLKRVSEVAVAGESPILRDVTSASSMNVLKTLSLRGKKTTRPKRDDGNSDSGSSTLSLEELVRSGKVITSTQVSAPQQECNHTIDLLATESVIESSTVNKEANVLRIEESPDPEMFSKSKRLRCHEQLEMSVRKAAEWVSNLPHGEGDEPVEEEQGPKENSIVSTMNRTAPHEQDTAENSVLIVAPPHNVREVQILLQRIDPQVLLRVPIDDIQNLVAKNPTLTQIQETMSKLITSNKIGVMPLHQRSLSPSHPPVRTAKKSVVKTRRKSKPVPKQKKTISKGKRKLFTIQRQPSTISRELDLESNNELDIQCPYTPPAQKGLGRPVKKTHVPAIIRRLQSDLPKGKSKVTRGSKLKETDKRTTAQTNEPVRRTRSSDLSKLQAASENNQIVVNPEANKENVPGPSNTQPASRHEMTLRKKSLPPKKRKTSLLFQTKPQQKTPRPKRKSRTRVLSKKLGPVIVCTFLHRDEVETVFSVAKKLGGVVENKVSNSTTHVICGAPKRTINLLKGIARGCWLVSLGWALQSLEKGQWIDPEPYEMTNFSPAVQKCRITKETLGIYPTIFKNVGSIYVGQKTVPPKSDLWELLNLCGAKIVTTTRRANISVGAFIPGVKSVSELWVLDSIQENILLPLKRYYLKQE